MEELPELQELHSKYVFWADPQSQLVPYLTQNQKLALPNVDGYMPI